MWDTITDVFTGCAQNAALTGVEKGTNVAVEQVGK